jgi:hypothetical protein
VPVADAHPRSATTPAMTPAEIQVLRVDAVRTAASAQPVRALVRALAITCRTALLLYDDLLRP